MSGRLADESEPEHVLQNADFLISGEAELLIEQAAVRLRIPERLLNLSELDVLYDPDCAALWTYMQPCERPSFTPSLLTDFETWQSVIGSHFGPDRIPLRYLILGSRTPGVFCFGGDLALFQSLIREGDRDALVNYGKRCVAILSRNIAALDLPMLTVGLVQGQALGGGMEALLSFDFIVAERDATFGLPEIAFGLFPGMGAHALLTRKLGAAMADRMILSNATWSAEYLYDLGLVHRLAEPGEGVAAVHHFMSQSERRHSGLVGARRAAREVSPVNLQELDAIVEHWADAALGLREQDLRLMQRLSGAQLRLAKAS
jgi:DSF synthase